MSKAVATIVIGAANLALGVTAGQFKFEVVPKDPAAAVPTPQLMDTLPADGTVTFDPVSAGDYTFKASRLGSDGNPIADAVTVDFTIPSGAADGATADVPKSVTIQVS